MGVSGVVCHTHSKKTRLSWLAPALTRLLARSAPATGTAVAVRTSPVAARATAALAPTAAAVRSKPRDA